MNRPVPDPWYRHFWPWMLIAVPLLAVVIGSGISLWLALSHEDPLVIEPETYNAVRSELRAQDTAVKAAGNKEPRQEDG